MSISGLLEKLFLSERAKIAKLQGTLDANEKFQNDLMQINVELQRQCYGTADDLRKKGWIVIKHDDYWQEGRLKTTWIVAKGTKCFLGDGHSDQEALEKIRSLIWRYERGL